MCSASMCAIQVKMVGLKLTALLNILATQRIIPVVYARVDAEEKA